MRASCPPGRRLSAQRCPERSSTCRCGPAWAARTAVPGESPRQLPRQSFWLSTLDVRLPERRGQPPGVLIKIDGARRAQLRNQDDLREMLREVFDDVEDGAEDGDVAALNGPGLEQLAVVQVGQHAIHFVQRALEIGKQHGSRRSTPGGKLFGTMACVRLAPDAGEDPLADVAVQVEQQV